MPRRTKGKRSGPIVDHGIWKPTDYDFLPDWLTAVKSKFQIDFSALLEGTRSVMVDELTPDAEKLIIREISSGYYWRTFADVIRHWAKNERADLFKYLGKMLENPNPPFNKMERIIIRSWSTGNDTWGIPLKFVDSKLGVTLTKFVASGGKVPPWSTHLDTGGDEAVHLRQAEAYRKCCERLGLARDLSVRVKGFALTVSPDGVIDASYRVVRSSKE